MSPLTLYPIGRLEARVERPIDIFRSLTANCPILEEVEAVAWLTPEIEGEEHMGAPYVRADLSLAFGGDARFGVSPQSRRRTTRAVMRAVLEAGGRVLHPAVPAHFLASSISFGEPWAHNQIFARVSSLHPEGRGSEVQKLVFLHQPVDCGNGVRSFFALIREEIGCGFRVETVDGHLDNRWFDDVAFVVGAPPA